MLIAVPSHEWRFYCILPYVPLRSQGFLRFLPNPLDIRSVANYTMPVGSDQPPSSPDGLELTKGTETMLLVLSQRCDHNRSHLSFLGTATSIEEANQRLNQITESRGGRYRDELAAILLDPQMSIEDARAISNSLIKMSWEDAGRITVDYGGYYEDGYRRWLEQGDLGTPKE